jgi:hypothetical protein
MRDVGRILVFALRLALRARRNAEVTARDQLRGSIRRRLDGRPEVLSDVDPFVFGDVRNAGGPNSSANSSASSSAVANQSQNQNQNQSQKSLSLGGR